MQDVTLHSRVSKNERAMVRKLEGESVLLHLGTAAYHGLDEVGTRFWELIGEHEALDQVLAQIVAEFDVSREVAEVDLLALVRALKERDLVHVR